MRNLLGILAFALSLMPSAMFAQVSNNNEDGVYKTERHNHGAFRQGEVIVKLRPEVLWATWQEAARAYQP